MSYAIVCFTEEDDSPGTVASNWINFRRNTCWFPNVRSEVMKKKHLMARSPPGKDWIECPMRVLQLFDTYYAAQCHLSTAEETTSNLESEEETKRHKRRKRFNSPPKDSTSTSDEDPILVPSRSISVQTLGQDKMSDMETYPIPPCIKLEPDPDPVQTDPTTYPVPPCIMEPEPIQTFNLGNIPGTETMHSIVQGSSTDLEQIKVNIREAVNLLLDLSNKVSQINSKLDAQQYHVHNQKFQIPVESYSVDIMAALPAGIDFFEILNKKIASDTAFRQSLLRVLTTLSGRDPKALVAQVLRKLISDDVGEVYSLTGKHTKSVTKQSFEKTPAYKLVIDTCFHSYSNTKENILREAISDWLMQAKFRKSRRAQRASNEGNTV